MDSLLFQLGVGGIFVVLILRLVFEFLQKTKLNGNSKKLETYAGSKSVEFCQN